MTRAALVWLMAVSVACRVVPTDPELGQAVRLRLGASVRIPNDTMTVRFTDVTADSRCPQGAQCIWEGDAATVFTTSGGTTFTLHTAAAGGESSHFLAGKFMRLLVVEPTPRVGRSIAKRDYVVTIRFDAALD